MGTKYTNVEVVTVVEHGTRGVSVQEYNAETVSSGVTIASFAEHIAHKLGMPLSKYKWAVSVGSLPAFSEEYLHILQERGDPTVTVRFVEN